MICKGSSHAGYAECSGRAARGPNGSNVQFDSFSGGTREQISMISRLICTMTVSSEGGALL
ncbi:MAG: hypothetical protein ACTSYJ_01300, partial [Candidatus Thorarchaeota archaeon]